MKKLILVLALVSVVGVKDLLFYWGGSEYLVVQNTVTTNVLGGWQISENWAIVGNYYTGDRLSIDGVFKG